MIKENSFSYRTDSSRTPDRPFFEIKFFTKLRFILKKNERRTPIQKTNVNSELRASSESLVSVIRLICVLSELKSAAGHFLFPALLIKSIARQNQKSRSAEETMKHC